MKVQMFAIERIKLPDGRRALDSATVNRLAESMQEHGLLQPIGIKPDGTLIWGAHRLAAAKRLGWKEIEVVIKDVSDIQAGMLEIEENLCRADTPKAERIKQTTRLKEFYEALYPQTKHGGDRKSDAVTGSSPQNGDLIDRPPSFVSATAKKASRGGKAVERDVRIGKAFGDEGVERLCRAGVGTLEMDALSSLKKKETEVVTAIMEKPDEELKAAVLEAVRKPKAAEPGKKGGTRRRNHLDANGQPWQNPGDRPRTLNLFAALDVQLSVNQVRAFYTREERLEWIRLLAEDFTSDDRKRLIDILSLGARHDESVD